MSRLTWDGTAEPVSRAQILRHVRGQGNIHFPCPADHEQDWQPFSLSMEMSRLTRDGTTEPVSRAQILRHVRGRGNIHFPCPADHEQDWQPYSVDPYLLQCDDHTHIHQIQPEYGDEQADAGRDG